MAHLFRGNFLCGVPCRDPHGSAHKGAGSETAVEQVSQQVMAVSSTRPEECYADYSSPIIYPAQRRHEILRAGTTAGYSEEHIISKKIADATLYKFEFAFMGMESDPTEENTLIICNGGATTTLTSSFENCTDCKPRKININLAEGGVAMVTTHEVMKTYYLRTRTGEFCGLTTKAFVTPGLRHDLLSVEGLNRQGYCVVQHSDPVESGNSQ